MNIDSLQGYYNQFVQNIIQWSTSPDFYAQCGLILVAIATALTLTYFLKNYFPVLRTQTGLSVFSEKQNLPDQ